MTGVFRFFQLLAACLLLYGCTNMLFYPLKQQFTTPDSIGVRYDDIYIQTADSLQLHGWLLHAEHDPVGTILYFHGNAENISTHFGNVYWLTRYGYDVILFDYRGYGESEGKAELDGIISDAGLMIRYAVDQSNTAKLVVLGQSLGASVAMYAVAHSRYQSSIDGLVSLAGFSDYHEVARDVLARSWVTWLFQWPLSFAISNEYSPVEAVKNLSGIPLVIMQSPDDEVIEYYHAGQLMEAAQPPRKFVRISGSHNLPFKSEENRQRLLQVLSDLPER